MSSGGHKGGLGPWFCALYFNLADGPKKQTDLRVHTYPLLFERLMNGPRSTSMGGQGWVIIMMVGYFEKWADALAFHTLWSKQTRGKVRRIQRGLDLFNNYTSKYSLKLWAQPLTRKEALEAWRSAYKEQRKNTRSRAESERNELPNSLFTNRRLLLSNVHKTQQKRIKQQK